ncbi:asparagine synthase (glutamine-hydrolyzing) [Lutimonas halocynthiae]|uniref:asparagine synthase (glutamine-hydrolyzing) n=1 Tax=Lutimonas halocynthiae TaxID=1446477 RepID=UPI0025B57FCE|nr:asparagine synthase (glutamine-hydrolyzing) [Lutimonas halocynthiae]MDN3641070.1 asparagine synthase (glutamine-hydrolyzing) [Lutimonas halocynthiae]
MCGICGAISENDIEIERMVDSIHHRGPDFQDTYKENKLSLGHVRLSILDLSSAGNQPMLSRSGKVIIVYNGEVYNFRELRKELISQGVIFRSNCDTEVILEGFEKWGDSFFEKLNGMFAMAIFDKERKVLKLVRDRFGIKPLYYSLLNDELIFASEIKGILASNRVSKEMSFQGLHEYLHFSTTLGITTFYKDIKKLLPGHILNYDLLNKKVKIAPFKLNYDLPFKSQSANGIVQNVRTLFEKSVKRQLMADVPIGVFLSGGIDSTAITSLANRHYNGRLKTFSAGFDFDKGINELPNAKLVSKLFDTDHHEMHIKGGDVPSVLENINSFFDQPFSDAANIPLYLMGRELKGNHKVILQGDGGDELFAGYNQYYRIKNENLYKMFSFIGTKFAFGIPKSSKYYRKLRSMYAVCQSDKELITARLYSQEMINENTTRIFKDDLRSNLDLIDPFIRHRQLHNNFKHFDLLQELLYTDMNTMLPDQYLEKVDRATMANSLEVRVPFLDNDLAAYVMSLPSKYKIQGKEKKYLLKKAFAGIVPDNILYGPKRGFSVPFQYWLRTSMKDYMFDTIKSTNIYSDEVEKMMVDHVNGRRDYGYILWKLLNLSIWYRKTYN